MLKLSFNTKIIVAVLAFIGIIILNYDCILFGINSDFFGVLFSIVLFSISGRTSTSKSNYFVIFLILICEFVSYRLHTNTLHFLSLALLICLVYNYFSNKFSIIAVVCVLLFSTLFNKFFEHLSSEIKQSLCYYAFIVLKNCIAIEKIEGVNFYINHAKIAIDTACMGLSMLKTGLLTGAFLLTFEENKLQKQYSYFQIIIFCFFTILCTIIANYFRIILLVLLQCTQENMLHYTIGMVCFLVYQVLPMLFFVKFFKPKRDFVKVEINKKTNYSILILFVIVFITSLEMKNDRNDSILENINSKYNIKNGKWVTKEVFKIISNDTLIYIKTPSHKPLICWTGNGYSIIELKEITVKNEKIWYNKMEKNNIIYNSYWWYECGDKKYTSFVEVMFMRLIYNEPIRLINETSLAK